MTVRDLPTLSAGMSGLTSWRGGSTFKTYANSAAAHMQSAIPVHIRQRVAATLFWRGLLITFCAAIAVRWPADGLLLAMAVVGALAIGFGIYDVLTAARLRSDERAWMLLLHGALNIVFGVVSMTATALSRHEMLMIFAGWLVVAGAVAIATALLIGARRAAALACLTILAASVVAIALLATDSRLSALILLYAGACYATLFGMTEVGLGQWLRRATTPMNSATGGAAHHASTLR